MPIFAYADETIFTLEPNTDVRALGCGILICKAQITPGVILEAIQNLSTDTDFDEKKDKRTLDRQYFHASDDSKNAHSHFCKSINKHVTGVFDFTYFDNSTENQVSNLIHTEGIFKRCLTSSSIEFFNYPAEVFLIIEKRNNLNNKDVERWKESIYRLFEGSSYDIPSYKTYFPKINIILAGKSNPGLQVVDFMLWAVNRSKKIPPNEIWMKRLAFKNWHYYKDGDGHKRGQYYLNCQPDINLKVNYDLPFKKADSWDEVIEAFILIERFLRHIDESNFTNANSHLWKDVTNISKLLKDDSKHLKSENLELIGRLFIRLFDTLPLYADISTDEEWKLMFHAKYLAAMLTRKGQIHLSRTKAELTRWRYKMQTEHFNEFVEMMKE